MSAVSVIVPVYNVSTYLRRCLDSCVYQTLTDIEVVIVDDCTQDDTDRTIIEEYAQNYPGMVRVLRHSVNMGLGEARNTGIRAAIGEYILFCDGDDFLDFSACEKMHRVALEHRCDAVVCDYIYMRDGILGYRRVNDGIDRVPRYERPYYITKTTVWVMMIKKTVITDNNLFSGFRFAEDNITALWYLAAGRVSKINEALYYYVYRKNSLVGGMGARQSEDVLNVYYSIMQGDYFNSMCTGSKNAVIFCALRKFFGFWMPQALKEDGGSLRRCFKTVSAIRSLSEDTPANRRFFYEENRFTAMIEFAREHADSPHFNEMFKAWYAQMDKTYTQRTLLRLKERLMGRRITLWAAGSYGKIFSECLRHAGMDFETTDIVPYASGYVPWERLRTRTDVLIFSSFEFVKGAGEIHGSIETLDLLEFLNENFEVDYE